ncbi:MAG: hypothetical protein HS104_16365 [Polyangiaceae bacterium]|nr:hypothetical protein [Polyangiaceae bacterium]
MDARPIRPGHVLIIPRLHDPDLLDLDGPAHSRVFEVVTCPPKTGPVDS